AAKGDGEIAFSFADVVRDQIGQQAFDAAQKFSGLGKRTDVAADFRIFAGEGAQARDEMRVGKKTHIENQVGVRGNSIAIAETDDGNEHGALVGILEAGGDEMAQFVNVELGGFDDHVGELS